MGMASGFNGQPHEVMADFQEQYDDAMFDYSQGEYDVALAKLNGIL
jgi:hypothetical protein